ncbi:hypothetical protein EYF80_054230 [Liparis tanakae]|uniref:Uncharacterized protein n=1 Tax=Liparis tanakae TaxID=230148 RepID=A0A4Z2F371_9TELE|nr:hypothetical protein EYF80_054230 [Liparis tanakae]
MPLGKVGSPQDTLTEVVVSSLKWMKLGALGAGGFRGPVEGEIVIPSALQTKREIQQPGRPERDR